MKDDERELLRELIKEREDAYLNNGPADLRPLREKTLYLRRQAVTAIARKNRWQHEIDMLKNVEETESKKLTESRLRLSLEDAINEVERIRMEMQRVENDLRKANR